MVRQLSQKLGKALNENTVNLAAQDHRVAVLEGQLATKRDNKRKQVVPDPIGTFVNIEAVKRAKK